MQVWLPALLTVLLWAADIPPGSSGATQAASGSEAAPAAAPAEAARPEIVGVRVGVGGRYKPGCWTEVEVTLRGAGRLSGGEVALVVPDCEGVPSRVSVPVPSSAPVSDPDQTSVLLYARFGRVRSELCVELRAGGEEVARRVFEPGATPGYAPAVSSEQELLVTVGRGSPGVEEAVRLLRQPPKRRPVVVQLDDVGQLPSRWYGYESVDAVVLSTSDPGLYAGLEPTSPRLAALDEWVSMGGRLVLCLGRHAEAIAGPGSNSPLARFVPGRLEKMVTLSMANAFELYCGSSVRIPLAQGGLRVPYLVDVQGKVETADGPLPLVIQSPRRFGQVVCVTADLDQPPFAEWDDRGFLAGKLLGYSPNPSDEDQQGTALMHYGYSDLAGQLRSALDRFPGVWVVPFALVVGLVVLYILAIGPGDYFLLRKLVGQMHLTWITFPAIVLAFSAAALVLAHRLKGDRVRVNQVDVVDVDVASGRVRGTAWANLFSPRTARYDLQFRPQVPGGRPSEAPAVLTAWLGLAGGALGGMDPRTAEPSIWQTGYDFSRPLDAMRGVPIPIWSTRSFTARWSARAESPLSAELVDEDGLLEGTVASSLGVPLADCFLAYNIHAYELDTLDPGETIRVGPDLKRRELKSLLTGRQIVFNKEKDDYRSQTTPYDQSSAELPYILRAMMFFQEAGGRGYTGLDNGYQGFIDMTRLLHSGRAMLVGRAAGDATLPAGKSGAELVLDGRPVPAEQVRRTTVYRFVLPVKRGE